MKIKPATDTDSGSSWYFFYVGIFRCHPNGTPKSIERYSGDIRFIWATYNPSVEEDNPGFIDESVYDTWPKLKSFTKRATNGIMSLEGTHPPKGKVVAVFKGRPGPNPGNIRESDWVQINLNTTYGLLRTEDYWFLPNDQNEFRNRNYVSASNPPQD